MPSKLAHIIGPIFFQYCQLAQNQHKSQFLFHKNVWCLCLLIVWKKNLTSHESVSSLPAQMVIPEYTVQIGLSMMCFLNAFCTALCRFRKIFLAQCLVFKAYFKVKNPILEQFWHWTEVLESLRSQKKSFLKMQKWKCGP